MNAQVSSQAWAFLCRSFRHPTAQTTGTVSVMCAQVNVMNAEDFLTAVQDGHLAPPPVSASGVRSKPHAWRSSSDTPDGDQPMFLHESTARALGLTAGEVPDLVEYVLGRQQLKAHRHKVRSLLMHPPPPTVAAHIAAALRCAHYPWTPRGTDPRAR